MCAAGSWLSHSQQRLDHLPHDIFLAGWQRQPKEAQDSHWFSAKTPSAGRKLPNPLRSQCRGDSSRWRPHSFWESWAVLHCTWPWTSHNRYGNDVAKTLQILERCGLWNKISQHQRPAGQKQKIKDNVALFQIEVSYVLYTHLQTMWKLQTTTSFQRSLKQAQPPAS